HAQDLFLALHVDGQRQVDGPVGDLPLVTDLYDDGVEVDDWIDRIKTAVLPGGDLFGDRFGGIGDEFRGDLHLVDLLEVLLDLPNAQAPGIQADDAVVEPVEVPLVLGNESRLKSSVTIPGDFDRQLSVVTADSFEAVPIAGVRRLTL